MKISIVIPAYNAAPYLKEAIESALSQTYQPHEIIVVDDGSTDQTAEIARSFGSRIRLVQQANRGLSGARNRGIEEATGDWIALLDADDAFLPDKLRLQVMAAEQSESILLVYTGVRVLLPDLSTHDFRGVPPSELWPALRYRTPFHVGSTIIKRSALRSCGSFDETFRCDEDWDLWLRFLSRYSLAAFAVVTDPVAIYRATPGSLSSKVMDMLERHRVLLDTRLLEGLTGLQRVLWRKRILAKFFYDASIALREQGNPTYLNMALQSLREWPLCGEIVPALRYKVVTHMLLKSFGRYLRPPGVGRTL